MHYSRQKRKGFPDRGKCSILSCDRVRKYLRYCDYHYRKVRDKTCLDEDCKSIARKKGLCSHHYSMEVREGRLHGKMCSVPNCPNATFGSSYCSAHRSRLTRTGSVQAHIPIRTRIDKKPLGKKVVYDEDWEIELDNEIKNERKALVFGARPVSRTESPAPTYKVYGGNGTSVLDY